MFASEHIDPRVRNVQMTQPTHLLLRYASMLVASCPPLLQYQCFVFGLSLGAAEHQPEAGTKQENATAFQPAQEICANAMILLGTDSGSKRKMEP